jgi:hypothetical protein
LLGVEEEECFPGECRRGQAVAGTANMTNEPNAASETAALVQRLAGAAGRGFRAWVVDCGDGCKVWELAMLVDHAARQAGGVGWEILATGDSEATLDKAKATRRAGLAEDAIGEPYRSLYCQPAEKRGRWRIKFAFARQIFFTRLRTPGPLPSFEAFDLILRGSRVGIPDAHLSLLLRPGGVLLAAEEVSLRGGVAAQSPSPKPDGAKAAACQHGLRPCEAAEPRVKHALAASA